MEAQSKTVNILLKDRVVDNTKGMYDVVLLIGVKEPFQVVKVLDESAGDFGLMSVPYDDLDQDLNVGIALSESMETIRTQTIKLSELKEKETVSFKFGPISFNVELFGFVDPVGAPEGGGAGMAENSEDFESEILSRLNSISDSTVPGVNIENEEVKDTETKTTLSDGSDDKDMQASHHGTESNPEDDLGDEPIPPVQPCFDHQSNDLYIEGKQVEQCNQILPQPGHIEGGECPCGDLPEDSEGPMQVSSSPSLCDEPLGVTVFADNINLATSQVQGTNTCNNVQCDSVVGPSIVQLGGAGHADSGTAGQTIGENAIPDVPTTVETPVTSDAPEIPDVPEIPDTAAVPDLSDPEDVPDIPDIPDTQDEKDAFNSQYAPSSQNPHEVASTAAYANPNGPGSQYSISELGSASPSTQTPNSNTPSVQTPNYGGQNHQQYANQPQSSHNQATYGSQYNPSSVPPYGTQQTSPNTQGPAVTSGTCTTSQYSATQQQYPQYQQANVYQSLPQSQPLTQQPQINSGYNYQAGSSVVPSYHQSTTTLPPPNTTYNKQQSNSPYVSSGSSSPQSGAYGQYPTQQTTTGSRPSYTAPMMSSSAIPTLQTAPAQTSSSYGTQQGQSQYPYNYQYGSQQPQISNPYGYPAQSVSIPSGIPNYGGMAGQPGLPQPATSTSSGGRPMPGVPTPASSYGYNQTNQQYYQQPYATPGSNVYAPSYQLPTQPSGQYPQNSQTMQSGSNGLPGQQYSYSYQYNYGYPTQQYNPAVPPSTQSYYPMVPGSYPPGQQYGNGK